ncbi:SEC-C motif-containing protein / OTU-like cysteine protease family protein [Striga hermonthica]|uniref:SEC-C motif-containing protein / OTU-like cysteine protease family protein n=1 Tax=Striga hermonthica TaxID=68872 RepID=A0A9N7NP61_STRHE|nr:SEC-C motif-containing protein / OTU-like cysteine protease family protein [Striga hermonthica]
MARPKHHKAKPSRQAKQPQPKKRGGKQQNDVSELRGQLDALGLKIIQVTADGNCFFRALADQLDGDEDEHEKYRNMVVQFIKNNREQFEPFVEDEVPFEEYCRSMGEDGTWAGHVELQAASLVTHSNICIHRNMSPRWYIRNFDKLEARMIHLSYHDGEHYNSVRSKDDSCAGPAREIVIKGDAAVSANTNQPKATARKSKDEGRRAVVKAGSGCEDAAKVEQALQQMGGDVDAAVEILLTEQRLLDGTVADEPQCEKSEHPVDETCKLDSSGNGVEISCQRNSLQKDEKKISRNKACPCGSKKKYKSCCGAVAGKSSARFPVNQTVDYGKSRKDRKQARKVSSAATNTILSDGGPPDMGSLCI